jgi:hypothetical protein
MFICYKWLQNRGRKRGENVDYKKLIVELLDQLTEKQLRWVYLFIRGILSN